MTRNKILSIFFEIMMFADTLPKNKKYELTKIANKLLMEEEGKA